MIQPEPAPAIDCLMEFLIAALVPILTAGSIVDTSLARLAAQQAIAAYQGRGQHELVTIAQIVAFALTALDNLRLSMPADLSLSMKLKLRGNANALNRAARDSAKALDKSQDKSRPDREAAMENRQHPRPDDAEYQDKGPLPPPSPQSAPTNPEPPQVAPAQTGGVTQQRNQLHWAGAMNTVATRLSAREAIVPPTQRKADKLWIDALTAVAGDLTQGKGPVVNPAKGRANLLRTTLMADGFSFPLHFSKA
jgi:hypothetical protein